MTYLVTRTWQILTLYRNFLKSSPNLLATMSSDAKRYTEEECKALAARRAVEENIHVSI